MSVPFYRHPRQQFIMLRASELHVGHCLALGNNGLTHAYGAVSLKRVLTDDDAMIVVYRLPEGARMNIKGDGLECSVDWDGAQALITITQVIPSSQNVLVLA